MMIYNKIYSLYILLVLFNGSFARPGDLVFNNDRPTQSNLPLRAHDIEVSPERRILRTSDSNTIAEQLSESNGDLGGTSSRSLKTAARKPKKSSGRIAWGQEATQGMFSFVVYVDGTDYMCSGSVIHRRAILTAAHCVRGETDFTNLSDMYVYIGNVDVNTAETYYVQAMYTPRYDTENLYGDIAIIQLTEEVPYWIKPVALATNSTASLAGLKTVTAIGFGTTEDGNIASKLRYADVATISPEKCKKVHDEYMGDMPVDHMCFGLNTNPSTSTCGGDSGGPYVIQRSGQDPVQVAVVSYGPADYECGDAENNLDIPTQVGYWRKWIDATLTMIDLSA